MVAHLVGVHTLHVNTVIILDDDCYYYHSWRNNVVTAFGTLVSLMYHEYHVKHTPEQRKLNSLKSESKGATNKTPTCMVPAHAPQTNTLWWGVGEVRSTGELGCWRRVQPRLFCMLAKRIGEWDVVWSQCPRLSAPFTKNQTHNLGPICICKKCVAVYGWVGNGGVMLWGPPEGVRGHRWLGTAQVTTVRSSMGSYPPQGHAGVCPNSSAPRRIFSCLQRVKHVPLQQTTYSSGPPRGPPRPGFKSHWQQLPWPSLTAQSHEAVLLQLNALAASLRNLADRLSLGAAGFQSHKAPSPHQTSLQQMLLRSPGEGRAQVMVGDHGHTLPDSPKQKAKAGPTRMTRQSER